MNFGFESYPFEKLRAHFAGLTQNPALKPLALTIGEPQFPTPPIILDTLCENRAAFSKYPASAGIPELKAAQIGFVKRRFDVTLNENQLLPTLGTRESLFNFPQFLLFDRKNPAIAYPNPFYQIYEGAAKACRARSVLLDLTAENGFKPDINDPRLEGCDLVILNSPNNPTGSVLSLDELIAWVKKAQTCGFVLLGDECYSEIYDAAPPPSLLQAAIKAGNPTFKNIIVMNSLSKRSSAAGIRSGFVAGDAEILKGYALYRTYAGNTAGVPLQMAAAAAWGDDIHAEEIRKKYAQNMQLARKMLNVAVPEATFYLWIFVGDDLAAAKTLYENYALSVLPGTFLSRGADRLGYIRLSLVHEPKETEEALKRVAVFLKEWKQ